MLGTRLNLAVYVMDCARKQKNITLKDFKDMNKILKKVYEKENIVVFGILAHKGKLCLLG